MANQVAYSKKSIIDLSKDKVKDSHNNIERSGGKLSLVGEASCGFEYTFPTTGKTLMADHLQLELTTTSDNNTDITRYNSNIAVLINIKYWEEKVEQSGAVSGYKEGKVDTYKIFPYLKKNESEGYFNTYNIDLDNKYVKSIYIKYINLSESTITFNKVKLHYSLTVSQAVAETVGFDISLLGVDFYPNAFQVAYDGTDENDKFYWNGDENDNLNGINVNNVKLIYIKNHTELLD